MPPVQNMKLETMGSSSESQRYASVTSPRKEEQQIESPEVQARPNSAQMWKTREEPSQHIEKTMVFKAAEFSPFGNPKLDWNC